jgi:hypothetical protein
LENCGTGAARAAADAFAERHSIDHRIVDRHCRSSATARRLAGEPRDAGASCTRAGGIGRHAAFSISLVEKRNPSHDDRKFSTKTAPF